MDNKTNGNRPETLLIRECPFCGSTPELSEEFNGYDHLWYILCSECGCQTDGEAKAADAVAVWNKRYIPKEFIIG